MQHTLISVSSSICRMAISLPLFVFITVLCLTVCLILSLLGVAVVSASSVIGALCILLLAPLDSSALLAFSLFKHAEHSLHQIFIRWYYPSCCIITCDNSDLFFSAWRLVRTFFVPCTVTIFRAFGPNKMPDCKVVREN